MGSLSAIGKRMEKIRAIFQTSLLSLMNDNVIDLQEAELEDGGNEFVSVAYEATAMGLALKDMADGSLFSRWLSFMQIQGAAHQTQVHVGLGWAMAKQQFLLLPFIETLGPLMRERVVDGYAYYEGIFRKERSVSGMLPLADLPNKYHHAYDQGLGRSLWYSCQGDCEKLITLITHFPEGRQKDLWRGVAIACVYVGGYDEDLLLKLSAAAGPYRAQLAEGAELVNKVRAAAGSFSPFTATACQTWCNSNDSISIPVNRVNNVNG